MFDDKSKRVSRVLTLLDISLTVVAFVVAYALHAYLEMASPGDLFSHLALLPLLLAFLIFLLPSFGAYAQPRVSTIYSYAWSVFRAVAASVAMLLTLIFLLKVQYASRLVIILFCGIDFALLTGVRALLVWHCRNSLDHGDNYLKVLIIGTGQRAIHLSKKLRKYNDWGIDIVGHLDPDPSRTGQKVLDAPVLGAIEDISRILKNYVIDEVILAVPRTMIKDVDEIASACEEEGLKLRLMADVFELHVARMSLAEVGGTPLLTLEPVAQDETKLLVKRGIDFFLTLLAMPVLLPVMGLIALAIKIDSPGPVFFFQERVGLRKRVFPMFKFRSMVVNAEQMLKELEHLNEAEGPIFKMKDDPRVTRVGKFIRRTSLDELPQLFNVLRGEMSLVGPRPMSQRDVNLFDKGIQRKRFSVKPGITCLWQISGRSNLPFSKWLELDLEYIEKWSLSKDFKILLKTIPVVLRGSGAV